MIGVVTACLAVKTVTIKLHQLMDGMGKEEEKTWQGRINAAEIMITKGSKPAEMKDGEFRRL